MWLQLILVCLLPVLAWGWFPTKEEWGRTVSAKAVGEGCSAIAAGVGRSGLAMAAEKKGVSWQYSLAHMRLGRQFRFVNVSVIQVRT